MPNFIMEALSRQQEAPSSGQQTNQLLLPLVKVTESEQHSNGNIQTCRMLTADHPYAAAGQVTHQKLARHQIMGD